MTNRFSAKRAAIMAVLQKQEGALSAAAINSALPQINLTTIYRNLDQFVKTGEVRKLTINHETLFEYQGEPHHHAVCNTCHRVIHFTIPDQKIKSLLGLDNFTIEQIELTVHGQCQHQLANH